MDTSSTRFPFLDHFLNAYMHQDWAILGDSLQDVVKSFVDDSPAEEASGLQADIGAFVAGQAGHLDSSFRTMFPNTVSPSGWGMTADQWLSHVAILAGSFARPTHLSGHQGD